MRTFTRQTAPGQPGPGVLHRYGWKRCTELPSQCGGHTNPCDPGMFTIPGTDVAVVCLPKTRGVFFCFCFWGGGGGGGGGGGYFPLALSM